MIFKLRTPLSILIFLFILSSAFHAYKNSTIGEVHYIDDSTISVSEPHAHVVETKSLTYMEAHGYTNDDLELLAHIINAEQGTEFDDEKLTNLLQIYCGQVVLNRLRYNYMGATSIHDVLYANGQYSCISDSSWDKPITERAYRNAEILLSGKPYWEIYNIPKMPNNVIFQAEFKQGSCLDNPWNEFLNPITGRSTYFCYE